MEKELKTDAKTETSDTTETTATTEVAQTTAQPKQPESPAATETPKVPNSRRKQLVILGFAVVVLLAIIGLVLLNQHNKQRNADAQKASLERATKQQADSSKDASKKDDASDDTDKDKGKTDQPSATSPAVDTTNQEKNIKPAPGASLSINKVQNANAQAYFGTSGIPDAETRQLHIITVTMKNLTTLSQDYRIDDFTATTDKGIVVKPYYYMDAATGSEWYGSTVGPNLSITKPVAFKFEDNIVTLTWKPSGASAITLTIPPATD